MSQAHIKVAKEALDHAVTTFKCSKAVLHKTLDGGKPVSERTLTLRMKNCEDALSALNTAHTTWVSKAEFSEDQLKAETYSAEWLENEWLEIMDLQEKFDEKLTLCTADTTTPIQSNAQKLQVCRKQMETLQLDIKTKIEQLMSRTSGETNPGATKVYEQMLSEVKQCLTTQFSELQQTILSLDGDINNTLDSYEKFRQTQQTHIVNIQLHLADAAAASHKEAPQEQSPQSLMKGVEMEKSKAPTFSGRTIDYPHFKRGWKKVAGAVWTDENQVEQIKLKVDARTRRIISRHKTMDEVWSALDSEYAQEQEVINAVNEELNNLFSVHCSTPEFIVELRNQLPILEDVLQEVDGIEFLQSPDRVNYMASRFDERTMYDWEYFRSKHKGSTYERFFQFLLDRYDACRSSIARLKSQPQHTINNTSLKCTECLADSHVSQDCHAASVDENDCRRCSKWVARSGVYTCPGCGRGTE